MFATFSQKPSASFSIHCLPLHLVIKQSLNQGCRWTFLPNTSVVHFSEIPLCSGKILLIINPCLMMEIAVLTWKSFSAVYPLFSINCLKSEPAAMPRSYMNHCCSKSSKRNCLRFSLIHLDNQKETKSVVSNEAACYGKCSLWTTLLQIKPFISIYPKQKQHKICISSLYISASEYWDMALWNTGSNSEVGYIVKINSS